MNWRLWVKLTIERETKSLELPPNANQDLLFYFFSLSLIGSQIKMLICCWLFVSFKRFSWNSRENVAINHKSSKHKSSETRDSHFWYLNFIGIILSSKIVPGSWWSRRGRIAADRCGRAVLAAMDTDVAALDVCDWDGDGSVVESDGLTQFRVVERLANEEKITLKN